VRRRLLTFSSCLSLLLCVATLGLWVRSYFVLDHVKHQWVLTRSELHSFRARAGGIRGVMSFDFQYIHARVDTPKAVAGREAFTRRCSSVLADRDIINSGGISISRPVPGPSSSATERGWRWAFYPAEARGVYAWTLTVWLPHWFLTLLFAIGAVPLIWLRPSRGSLHSCHTCGYDLTGNTSGVCPECGTAIPIPRSRRVR